jgi:hypothetical protein
MAFKLAQQLKVRKVWLFGTGSNVASSITDCRISTLDFQKIKWTRSTRKSSSDYSNQLKKTNENNNLSSMPVGSTNERWRSQRTGGINHYAPLRIIQIWQKMCINDTIPSLLAGVNLLGLAIFLQLSRVSQLVHALWLLPPPPKSWHKSVDVLDQFPFTILSVMASGPAIGLGPHLL